MIQASGGGAAMCARFYAQSIHPILDAHFPDVPHTAGLLDSGSEVLGFDDEMSRDHDWGPRAQIFVSEDDFARHATAIHATLARELPRTFEGFPTNFSPPDASDGGTRCMEPAAEGPVNHRIDVTTVRRFFRDYLQFDASHAPDTFDWLSFSEQRLRTVTCGPLFHDGIDVQRMRKRLRYYPRDVWLYLMAACWQRISQEEHLMGRAGHAGDEVGSALIGARLVRDAMRLCFLMAREYAPYAKWLGTAFRQLRLGPALYPELHQVLHAQTWLERERHLVAVYEALARAHNALGATPSVAVAVMPFFGRPFQVITHNGIVAALTEAIADPGLARLARRAMVGGLDTFSDSTDLTAKPGHRSAVKLFLLTLADRS